MSSGEQQRSWAQRTITSSRSAAGVSFAELVAPLEPAALERFEVVLRSGVQLRVPAGFQSEALRRLLDVLEPAVVLPAQVRILLCAQPQDFRKSFDGLALAARQELGEDPQSGAIFVFFNKRLNRLKLLWWDESGYCLLYKRLHRARVELPVSASTGQRRVQIDALALASLLRGSARERRGAGSKAA